jgi:hypothetical protein
LKVAREFVKLAELTPEIYLRYKRSNFEDIQIARLYDCSGETLSDWKKANGLNGVSIRHWSTWEKYFPKEVEKMIKQYKELYNRGWKRDFIAEEMGMSRGALCRFVDRFVPEYKAHTVKLRLTDEQKEIIKANGLKIDTVRHRIHAGWPMEKALTDPPEEHLGSMTANVQRGWNDLSDEHRAMAIQNKIPQATVIKRLGRGWTDELAVTKAPRQSGNGKGKKK